MCGPRLTGWLFRAATRLLSWLPLPLARRAAHRIGEWAAGLPINPARVTRINLSRCFPDLDETALAALTRESLGHTCQLFAEAGALRHWRGDRLQRLAVRETGREWIASAFAQGRPVLMLVPHYGNWEFLCYLLGEFAPVALYDPPRLRALQVPLLGSRQRFGMRMAPATPSGLRQIRRALHPRGLACILPDQAPRPEAGVFAPFFGQPALTMTLPFRLAQKTGAALLLGSALRVPGGFAAHYQPFAEVSDLDGPEAFAKALNQAIETLVRIYPAQYQWEYKRFKRPLPGCPTPYPKRR